MSPKELIDFLEDKDISFENLMYEEYDNDIMDVIGEYEIEEELDYNEDDKRSYQEIIIHFKTLGFYIEEKKSFTWGEFSGVEFSTTEPISKKIVFGNNKTIE
jgi:hypothetical protein